MTNFIKLGLRLAFKRFFGTEKPSEREKKPLQAAAQAVIHDKTRLSEAPLNLTIWTIERNRYAAPRALSTDIEVYPAEGVGLCEDITGYVIGTPNGESVVIEARTGSLVGHSLEVVRDGIREMTKAQLNTQLDTARKEFNRMKKQAMSNDEFWKAISMGSAEIEVSQDYQE